MSLLEALPATGVAVVTSADADGRAFGATAREISAVSVKPPLVLARLRSESETLAAIRRGRRFAINVLAADQHHLSDRFARPAGPDLWEGVAMERRHGVPILDGTLATVECVLHDTADGGDHAIVVGRVVSAGAPPAPAEPEVALPTALGALRAVPLAPAALGAASVAVLVGRPHGADGALLYLHRGCVLGDALGSRECGGRARLHAVVAGIERLEEPGVVVYHRAGGLGACCVASDDRPAVSDSEAAAVEDAIARLRLRNPRLVADDETAAALAARGIVAPAAHVPLSKVRA
jgi:flavin reductase (DIM6/NTAB) family NADH-FMN oxidoreductase RutF